MATVQRRLSVIVCADVVGYSRLMGDDELGTLTALKAHREAIDPLFAEEGGRLVKTTGDGLLLEFPSAFHAVRAGLAVQRLMAERNTDVPPDKRLVLRVGIHLGDVIVDGDDIFGDGVNIAARLESIAQPGGMCISQPVHETIHKNIDALFHDGGQQVLKNINEPVRVYNLALDGSVSSGIQAPAMPKTGPLLSLVVLPFVNLSGDKRHDGLVDNVTDQLTTELARIEDSFVVNRMTALAYRGDTLEIVELGLELGVRFVIRGNVRADAGALRVNVQLIDAESGQPLWIDRFDMVVGEPFAMQHEVIRRVIPPLHAHLLSASGRAPHPAAEVMPQAQGNAQGNGRGGNVIYPRATGPSPGARAVAPASAMRATSPAVRPVVTSSPAPPRPAPVVRRAAPGPAPAPAAPPRKPLRIPFLVKLIVIAIAGAAAALMLGTQRQSVVAILSWMLIAAGAIQMLSALVAGPRTD
jgi:class 3 adenylate cyclase/TolB-like protein